MADKKKGIALALLEILREHTDAHHHVSTSELIKLLGDYGYTAERRTVYANIKLLRDFGYEIDVWGRDSDGYALIEHQFTEKEVDTLCDLLKEAKGLSAKEKKALREKLLGTLSMYQRGKCEKKA